MVAGDVLQRVGDAADEIVLADGTGHLHGGRRGRRSVASSTGIVLPAASTGLTPELTWVDVGRDFSPALKAPLK